MKFKPLNTEFEHKESAISFFKSMFKLGDFLSEMQDAFETRGLDRLMEKLRERGGIPVWGQGERERWFGEGVECEILKPGDTSWKQGKIKIKIVLEFCPKDQDMNELDPSLKAILNLAEEQQ